MQIVIDIPDGYIGVVMANQRTEGTAMDKLLRQAVIDGTPLPKGHGRLKDVDWIDDNCDYCHADDDGRWCYSLEDIDNAPTIIEADKGDKI